MLLAKTKFCQRLGIIVKYQFIVVEVYDKIGGLQKQTVKQIRHISSYTDLGSMGFRIEFHGVCMTVVVLTKVTLALDQSLNNNTRT